MNIFALSTDPYTAASMQHDKHVVKMPLETAQILCTVAHGLGIAAPYKPTHKHHPCTVWAATSRENTGWLISHGLALCHEYTYRYGKQHASMQVIEWAQCLLQLLPSKGQTPFAQAMPEEYRGQEAVLAYRRYYLGAKLGNARYTRREPPAWATLA